MTIEIINDGGIYAYRKDEQILYIGKTKNFNSRHSQHQSSNDPTEFEQLLRKDDDIEFYILYDCKACPLTTEQLDYLETCFITALKPKYNIQKLNRIITIKENTLLDSLKRQPPKLTPTESIVYTAITTNFKSGDKFTRYQLEPYFISPISISSCRRGISKMLKLNIINLFYTDANNENTYIVV